MSADKYPRIFSPQMEAIVYLHLGVERHYIYIVQEQNVVPGLGSYHDRANRKPMLQHAFHVAGNDPVVIRCESLSCVEKLITRTKTPLFTVSFTEVS